MTYYSFEFQQENSNTVNGVQQETYTFKYTDAPQLILKYLRVDSMLYVGAAVSGEASGNLTFQYFNADPPITSIATQVGSSLTSVFNGLRFNIDRYKPFEFSEGLPLPTSASFSLGLDWYGLPPGIDVDIYMSVTMGFYVPSGEKASGAIIPPDKVFKADILPTKMPFEIQRFPKVTIGGKNPTREVPTA
jgi:hypothetical protein